MYPSDELIAEAYARYYEDEDHELDAETFMVRWACDWQREQDAQKCEKWAQSWSREPFVMCGAAAISAAKQCAKAIREAGNE